MSISKITVPLNNAQLVNKINEIIDTINGYATTKPCVNSVSVNGTTITLGFTDGSTATRTTQDTTYSVATTSANGLMSSVMVTNLNNLATDVSALATRVSNLEPNS